MSQVKLHRCPIPALGPLERWHACARVQDALDEQGIEYEVVKEPLIPGKRDWIKEHTQQKMLPVLEFDDGSTYREESRDMAARTRAGKLFDGGAA
ncbi:MAG: glutathione S-transferase N-terminal domain-containing protein [Solirubrobacterales bacterium]